MAAVQLRRPPSHSRARLDMVALVVLVPLERAAAAANSRGPAPVRLLRLPGVPAGWHPLMIEAWHVKGGLLEPGNVGLDAWAERAGRLVGAIVGGKARRAAAGKLGALGRRVVEEGARRLGSFHEIFVTVPAVLPDSSDQPVSTVLRMYTDSTLSALGDRLYGFGFDKRLARVSWSGLEHSEVRHPDGRRLLTVQLEPSQPTPEHALRVPPSLLQSFAAPLSTRCGTHEHLVCHLDRSFDSGDVEVRGQHGHLVIGEGFLDHIEPGTYTIAAASARRPWGSFSATNVVARLSFPRVSSPGQAARR